MVPGSRPGERTIAGPAASPPAAPALALEPLIGQFGETKPELDVFERDGALWALWPDGQTSALERLDESRFSNRRGADVVALQFGHDAAGTFVAIDDRRHLQRDFGTEAEAAFRASLGLDTQQARDLAAQGQPPIEPGTWRTPDLVAIPAVAPTIRLDVRYATMENFMGLPLYDRPAAYLQRPAALALTRVQDGLAASGLSLVVQDAYRPWSVTRLFWEVTPLPYRAFVADPAIGSKHNRGCAVDVGLVDLASDTVIPMPSRHDEATARAQADYVGGTSRQRWFRDLLKAAMQAERFVVHPDEWWHFDFIDWPAYAISNISFAELDGDAV